MPKVALELSAQDAERLTALLAGRLTLPAKRRLAEELEREMRRARWEPMVTKMRRRFAQRPLSARALRQLCETVRQEHFERERRAGRR